MIPPKAYKNMEFLNSPEARAIRILCEYEEPMRRFQQNNVTDTIVFFGSARAKSREEFERVLLDIEKKVAQGEPLQEELYATRKQKFYLITTKKLVNLLEK